MSRKLHDDQKSAPEVEQGYMKNTCYCRTCTYMYVYIMAKDGTCGHTCVKQRLFGCALALFPGSPALECEHCNHEGRESLVSFSCE